MKTRREKVLDLLREKPGLSDREITNIIDGNDANQVPINTLCNKLNNKGVITRKPRPDGKLGNYLIDDIMKFEKEKMISVKKETTQLAEDDIKHHLQKWLLNNNWRVSVRWGKERGVDIDAQKEKSRWLIEVKGEGDYQQKNANYFINILGEILTRMNEKDFKYSIAVPDIKQYRNLWGRFPSEAKQRTQLSVLFVDEYGNIEELFE